MANLVQNVKKSLMLFARDKPGQRFIRHHRRSRQNRSPARTVLRIAAGTIFTAVGVLLWFLPGPGWLFVFFGLALFTTESRTLACFLDRAEVAVREQAQRLRRWWHVHRHAAK
jgi:Putative transmembrane protein (PGPGW)